MNQVIYYLLNKIHGTQTLDSKFQETLYKCYEYGSQVYNYNIEITKEDFQGVFSSIYDVLRFRIDDEDFRKLSEHYLELLIADARDGDFVDTKWLIDHVWYLYMGMQDEINTEKYRDCILFIQDKLTKKFNIEENLKEKIDRKLYTMFMS